METQIYLAKILDILKVDKRNIETCLKHSITLISFHQLRELSEINYTFVKKIQWQTL